MDILSLLRLYRSIEASGEWCKQLGCFNSLTGENLQAKQVCDEIITSNETSYTIIRKLVLFGLPSSLEDVAIVGSKTDLPWYCTQVVEEYGACPNLWVDGFYDSYLFIKNIILKKKKAEAYLDFFKAALLYVKQVSVYDGLGEKQQGMAERLAGEVLQVIDRFEAKEL